MCARNDAWIPEREKKSPQTAITLARAIAVLFYFIRVKPLHWFLFV
jgi:hypothetical protein